MTSGAVGTGNLTDVVVKAAFGVENEGDWEVILDNYGNARTTVNEKTSERAINVGSYEETVSTELYIAQDGKYIVFTLPYAVEEGVTYTFSLKASNAKRWSKPVEMKKVTLEDGTDVLYAKVSKYRFSTSTSSKGYDYKLEQVGESEPIVSGVLNVRSQAIPSVMYKATGVKAFMMTFRGTIDEARTVVNGRFKNGHSWSEWTGESTLAELLEDGSVTKLENGSYLFDFSENADMPAGAQVQIQVYFASNVIINDIHKLNDNEGTLLLQSLVLNRMVNLLKPQKLVTLKATVTVTDATKLTVDLKKVDSRTEKICYQYKVGNEAWSEESSVAYDSDLTTFTIEGLALPTNTNVLIRLWESAPSNINVTDSKISNITCRTPKQWA